VRCLRWHASSLFFAFPRIYGSRCNGPALATNTICVTSIRVIMPHSHSRSGSCYARQTPHSAFLAGTIVVLPSPANPNIRRHRHIFGQKRSETKKVATHSFIHTPISPFARVSCESFTIILFLNKKRRSCARTIAATFSRSALDDLWRLRHNSNNCTFSYSSHYSLDFRHISTSLLMSLTPLTLFLLQLGSMYKISFADCSD
jgi:hypothetical protein